MHRPLFPHSFESRKLMVGWLSMGIGVPSIGENRLSLFPSGDAVFISNFPEILASCNFSVS
jgi:hypothetical protein